MDLCMWFMTPSRLVRGNRRFGEICCLRLQGQCRWILRQLLSGTHRLPMLVAVESANLGERLVGNFPLISTDSSKGQSIVSKRKSEEHMRPLSSTSTSLHTEQIIFSPFSLALLKNCEGFEKYSYLKTYREQRMQNWQATQRKTTLTLQLVKKSNLWEVNKEVARRTR